MTTSLRAIDLTPADDRDGIVGQCPTGLVFHLSSWLEALRDTQGSRLKRYGPVSSTAPRELVGIMPVFIKRVGLLRAAGSPSVVEDKPYMGPELPEERLQDALLAVRDAVLHEVSFLRVLVPYAVSTSSREALEAAGFAVVPKKTHRLNLTIGVEAIWKGTEGRCRTAVRRAEKDGVKVRRVTELDGSDIMRYYALAEQVNGHEGRRDIAGELIATTVTCTASMVPPIESSQS